MENLGFDEMEDKMETIWQVKVTKKPMDEKNELKRMEMGLQVCKIIWYAKQF
jgi:hypothetical protein